MCSLVDLVYNRNAQLIYCKFCPFYCVDVGLCSVCKLFKLLLFIAVDVVVAVCVCLPSSFGLLLRVVAFTGVACVWESYLSWWCVVV